MRDCPALEARNRSCGAGAPSFVSRTELASRRDDNRRVARGNIYHTYSCYTRGNELFNIHYHYLDVVPKGRDENGRGPFWVRRHDEYDK